MSLVGRQTFITTDKDGRGRRDRERTTASHITPIRTYDISLLIDHKRNHIPTQVLAPNPVPGQKKINSEYTSSSIKSQRATALNILSLEEERGLSSDLTDFRACPGLTRDVPSLHRRWI